MANIEHPHTGSTREAKYRIVDGVLQKRHTEPGAYLATVHTLNNGMVEASIRPKYHWGEVDVLTPDAAADFEASKGQIWVNDGLVCGWKPAPPLSTYEQLENEVKNRVRATRRARTKVRRLCKHNGFVDILTLTYRQNQTDRSVIAHDFEKFIKRIRRDIPDFEYLCVFERQKRGAWHAHLAVRRVLSHYWSGSGKKKTFVRSFDFLRSKWRGVVGLDNGNIDVSQRKKKERWSPAKIAGYISKYIGKDFGENLKHENSYSASNGDLPAPVRFSFENLSGALGGLYAVLSVDIENSDIYQKLFPDTSYWMSASPAAP